MIFVKTLDRKVHLVLGSFVPRLDLFNEGLLCPQTSGFCIVFKRYGLHAWFFNIVQTQRIASPTFSQRVKLNEVGFGEYVTEDL